MRKPDNKIRVCFRLNREIHEYLKWESRRRKLSREKGFTGIGQIVTEALMPSEQLRRYLTDPKYKDTIMMDGIV